MIKPLKHDTMETNKIETNKMENGILLVATYIIPHLGIYLRYCEKTLLFFTQVQRLERF